MYGPGRFSANTDVRFGTTNNKQTTHTACLPTTTTIVDYNPTPPRHLPLPTAPNAHVYGRPLTTNTNENDDDDDDVATPSHEPKQHTATIDDNAPNTRAMLPSPTATTHHPPPSRATHTTTTADDNHNERRWSVQATTWQRATSSRR